MDSAEESDAPDVAAAAVESESLRAELRQTTALLQRVKADFDNYRRRMTQEVSRVEERGVRRAVSELLPVLDNLERALAATAAVSDNGIRAGVEMTVRQFQTALSHLGVEPVPAVGQPFDPAVHQALAQVAGSKYPEGIVVAEMQKGYHMDEWLIRPALVSVATGAVTDAVNAPAAGTTESASEIRPDNFEGSGDESHA